MHTTAYIMIIYDDEKYNEKSNFTFCNYFTSLDWEK